MCASVHINIHTHTRVTCVYVHILDDNITVTVLDVSNTILYVPSGVMMRTIIETGIPYKKNFG